YPGGGGAYGSDMYQRQQATAQQNQALYSRNQGNAQAQMQGNQALWQNYQDARSDLYRNGSGIGGNYGGQYGTAPYGMGGMQANFNLGGRIGYGW
ncbi:MAG: hypothetical protein HN730_00145, partial [Bdellovibrionales bacterium]|nr:hypothetical protein [Bdellovibrionales bacterium]